MYTISNLTASDVKFLQFLAIKNETRLSGIIERMGKGEPKEIKKMYRDELKKNKALTAKINIRLY